MEQMNEKTKEMFTIPDKYRKVGNPYGQYVLYMEDYVHTFTKQYLQWKQKEISIAVYGKIYKSENITYIFINSACVNAAEHEDMFPQQDYLGTVQISGKGKEKKDNTWKLQLNLVENIQCNLEAYYIFYEKNEAMQNYLIRWHEENRRGITQEGPEISVKYARALQDCAHYEMEGSRQKQIFSIVFFAFSVLLCVMAITIMNNYQKMIQLQDNMTYIMAHIDELSEDRIIQKVETLIEPERAVTTSGNLENEQDMSIIIEETQEAEEMEEASSEEEALSEYAQTEENRQEVDPKEGGVTEVMEKDTNESEEQEITITYQVYTVKDGDTLRRIVWNQYHSFENFEEVCRINQIENPDEILTGQEIYLP